MKPCIRMAIVLAAGLSSTAMPAQATTYFTNRATFEAAVSGLTIVDFEGCPGGNTPFAGPVTSASCGGTIPVGFTAASPSGGELYWAAPGQSTNPTIALGLSMPQGGAITLVVPPTHAFGVDYFQNLGGGLQVGSPYTGFISLIGVVPIAPNGGSFFGIISDTPFTQVFIGTPEGFAVIDNVSYGAVVPEPATWATLILGLGMVGAALRRRRAAVLA